MRDYSLYLLDILKAFEAIESFVEDQSFEDFKKDDKASSAVIRKFEIIGEAAKQVPGNRQTKVSCRPLEGNGRDARQTDTLLFRSQLRSPLADDSKQNPSNQTCDQSDTQRPCPISYWCVGGTAKMSA
ncbi:MAG: HepT-like ribonuclease domain-containing protein [Planctomycetota bacterium]|jgi:hypothetical protein